MNCDWIDCISYFFGAIFLTNAIPHWVSGLQGRPFQSPFANPPGKGLSSSKINALWACFNLAVAYLLFVRVGSFDIRSLCHILPTGLGLLLGSVLPAHMFGKLHGGNHPVASK